MATPDDVHKLAALARIRLTDVEADALAREFEGILGYIGKLEAFPLPRPGSVLPELRNQLRPDIEPHETGLFAERIAAAFPDQEKGSLSVKQIISYD